MTYFLKKGNAFQVTSKEAMDLHEILPAGNYLVKQDMHGNFYLDHIDDFEIPPKLYGNTLKHTARIIKTFEDRNNSTGVLLNGEKGSGKTLLAKNLSIELKKMGLPTIVINNPWKGEDFSAMLQSIDQPCVILFDEFEKVYNSDDQESILTLLDGVFPSRKLFLLTCNDKWRVDYHMRNRPGRIYYMIDFKGLDADFIREYCDDNLNNKSHIDRIVQITGTFDQFNFDMLKALVEEMNRFDEGPQEAMGILNTKPEFSGKMNYEIKIKVDGKLIKDDEIHNSTWSGNPLTTPVHVSYSFPAKDEDGEEYSEHNDVIFQISHLKSIEENGTRYVFENMNKEVMILTRVKEETRNFMDLF